MYKWKFIHFYDTTAVPSAHHLTALVFQINLWLNSQKSKGAPHEKPIQRPQPQDLADHRDLRCSPRSPPDRNRRHR